MIILTYDTETTGLPNWKIPSDDPTQPHLVQLAAIVSDTETKKVISSIDLIIRPDGWEIPQEVTDIHGISTEYALRVGVPERVAFETFMNLWQGHLRVAHNRTFDQRIMRIVAKRYGTEDEVNAWANKDDHDCTMLLSKQAMKVGKFPKLSEAYLHFTGKELEDAHSAMPDAVACLDVYYELLKLKEAA